MNSFSTSIDERPDRSPGRQTRPGDYLPVEYLFNLFSLLRREQITTLRALRSAIQRRRLWSLAGAPGASRRLLRLPFWMRLSRAAGLVSEEEIPRPTLLLLDWLEWPLLEQMQHLLEAWMQVPASFKKQGERRRLLARLRRNSGPFSREREHMPGLLALGILDMDQRLTRLGAVCLGLEPPVLQEPPGAGTHWQISGDHLQITFPPNWRLVWQLEAYLDPMQAGMYSFAENVLSRSLPAPRSRDNPPLDEILSQGLNQPVPPALLEQISRYQPIRIFPGPLLEMNQPQDLVELRKLKSLHRDLDQLLSPRHVLIEPARAPLLFRALQRRGWLSSSQITPYIHPEQLSVARLNRADRAHLLFIQQLCEKLGAGSGPPGLASRLRLDLPPALQRSALHKADTWLQKMRPAPPAQSEETRRPAAPATMLEKLQAAIQRQESIDVLYRKPRQVEPEYRRLEPLLLEQRYGKHYLVAYCHMRRGNRLFRLDRMQLLAAPPDQPTT